MTLSVCREAAWQSRGASPRRCTEGSPFPARHSDEHDLALLGLLREQVERKIRGTASWYRAHDLRVCLVDSPLEVEMTSHEASLAGTSLQVDPSAALLNQSGRSQQISGGLRQGPRCVAYALARRILHDNPAGGRDF
jgi:hypothetical protein